ncbi:MAG: hypothetical protein HY958_02380 [Bacteroidia bacterium]|nr:hypothetical protein [Bacteroidia bacterium]
MGDKTDQEYNFNTNDLLIYINKNKQPLFIITVAAFVISTVVSLLLTPQYKSTAIIFPTATTSISNSLLSLNLPKKEILNFGKEEEVEQMLQVLQSDEIENRIVRKYDLMRHYKITSRYPRTALDEEYKDNITFIRTPYLSIEIEVYDRDPQTAADIANDIAALVDTTINNMLKERAQKAFMLVEKEYFSLKARKQALEDSLKRIQQKGISHYEYQSQALNEALGKAIADGKTNGAEQIDKRLKILAEYGAAYVSIRDLLEKETEKQANLESKFSEAKVDAEQNLPHKFVVNKAIKAEKSSYPIEWLIICISTVSAFLLGFLILILFDKVKKKRSLN